MPTSNDTRVRVDGFSKIIASVLPASGLCTVLPAFAASALRRRAGLEHGAQLDGGSSMMIEEMARQRS